ncbi:MAG: DUF3606 domain-containing protein [Hyphomicrobiales bacterium]
MTESRNPGQERTHLYPWDRAECEAFAARMGISDAKLRKAIRMVGSRITTLSSRLKA